MIPRYQTVATCGINPSQLLLSYLSYPQDWPQGRSARSLAGSSLKPFAGAEIKS